METFSAFLVGFLIGLVFGVVSYAYLSQGQRTAANSDSLDISAMLAGQIQYQQSQNMMRSLQLDASRQEAELRQLEQDRVKYLSLAQKPDYSAIVSQVSRELERQNGARYVN